MRVGDTVRTVVRVVKKKTPDGQAEMEYRQNKPRKPGVHRCRVTMWELWAANAADKGGS